MSVLLQTGTVPYQLRLFKSTPSQRETTHVIYYGKDFQVPEKSFPKWIVLFFSQLRRSLIMRCALELFNVTLIVPLSAVLWGGAEGFNTPGR